MLKVVFTRLVYEPFYSQMRFGKGDLSGRFRAFPGFTSLTFQFLLMLLPDKLHIHSHFHPLVRFSLIKKFYPIMLCIRVLLLAKLSFLTEILDMGHSFLFLFPFLYIDSLSHTFLSTIKKTLSVSSQSFELLLTIRLLLLNFILIHQLSTHLNF